MFSLHWYLVAVKEKYKPLSPSFWKCITTVLPLCFDKTPIIKSERKADEIAHFGNVFIWREVVLIKKLKKKNWERPITSKMCQTKIFLRLKLHDLIFSEIKSQHFLVFFRLHSKRQTKEKRVKTQDTWFGTEHGESRTKFYF